MLILFSYSFNILLGLAWGSFATMAAYRLANNKPWIGQKPFCTECGHHLSFIDYISLLSLALYKGKCRYCKKKYPYALIYFCTELLMLIYFVLNFHINNFSELLIINMFLIIIFVIWSVIFFNHKKNISIFLTLAFFIIIIKRVLLDNSIYPAFFITSFAVFISLLLRHINYAIEHNFKQSLNYLQYQKKPRLSSDDMIIIYLSIFAALILLKLKLILLILPLFSLSLLVLKKKQWLLPIIANIIIILMIFL